MLTHKEPKAQALELLDVKAEYERLTEEFALLDEFLQGSKTRKAELDRRIAACDERPNEGRSWEEIKRKLETSK